jgi:uncharacterized membrane protein YsdA (DUF1294 family)
MRQQGRRTGRNDDRARDARSAAVVALVFFALLAVLGAFVRVAWMILAVDVVVSAATFVAYRSDKLAARQGRWRTRESALHLLSFAGGWPGALVAQKRYHHKTRKQPFQTIFRLTVTGNLLVLAWLVAGSVSATAPG